MKRAFTLAEILITLGIIGIVAALTLPTLIKKIQTIVLRSQFKHSVATVTQALKLASLNLDLDNFGEYCSEYYDGNYIHNKECGEALSQAYTTKVKASVNGVYTSPINRIGKIKNFNSTKYFTNSATCMSTVIFQHAMPDGTYLGFGRGCGAYQISFDINGDRGPNKLGYDVFFFTASTKSNTLLSPPPKEISEEELEKYIEQLENDNNPNIDFYYANYGNPCNDNSTQDGNGIGCGYYALKDICYYDNKRKGYFECLK